MALPRTVGAAPSRDVHYAEHFRESTILFVDIVSYTSIASKITPIKTMQCLHQIYSAWDEIIERVGMLYKVRSLSLA